MRFCTLSAVISLKIVVAEKNLSTLERNRNVIFVEISISCGSREAPSATVFILRIFHHESRSPYFLKRSYYRTMFFRWQILFKNTNRKLLSFCWRILGFPAVIHSSDSPLERIENFVSCCKTYRFTYHASAK